MTPLALLACAVLSALSVQAKVVTDFKECKSFFYLGREPSGINQNAVKICQKYKNQFHFATLYSQSYRIPLYSAYTFDRSNLDEMEPCTRPTDWFIEPQLVGHNLSDEMSRESQFDWEQIKKNQAINSDYRFTEYDRGHLLPNTYLSTGNRRATFTLTNGAPMRQDFNRVRWRQVEQKLKKLLTEVLDSYPRGKAYIITGTVPHENDRIPKREAHQTLGDYERVTVPTHVWTAVCFVDDSDPQKLFSFSFGFIGNNSQNRAIEMHPFPQMNFKLMFLYSEIFQTQSVRVFVDDCNSKSRDQNREKQKNTWLSKLRPDIRQTVSKRGYQHLDGDQSSYLQELERGKFEDKQACVLTNIIGHSGKMGRRKRDVGSEFVQCQYVPEKSDPASMTAADGTRCLSDKRYCETKNGFELCCTTPCQYQENNNAYWCYSGQTKITCSPQYSSITIKNKKCEKDHPCATYGEDYYWCKVSDSWDYCSPPLWNSRAKNGQRCRPNHACAKYGARYYWCYTDTDDNWSECCTHDDCFSAINGKTCMHHMPCGTHGEDYLWCYTTDGSWDYCCKWC